jgi:uncharacterized membrane protein YccC
MTPNGTSQWVATIRLSLQICLLMIVAWFFTRDEIYKLFVAISWFVAMVGFGALWTGRSKRNDGR